MVDIALDAGALILEKNIP